MCPSVCPADRLTRPPPPLTSLTPLTPLTAPCVPQAIVAVIGLSVLAFGLQTDKDIARALGAPPSSDGRPMGSQWVVSLHPQTKGTGPPRIPGISRDVRTLSTFAPETPEWFFVYPVFPPVLGSGLLTGSLPRDVGHPVRPSHPVHGCFSSNGERRCKLLVNAEGRRERRIVNVRAQ